MTETNTPRSRLDRIEAQQEINTKAIADINQALNAFVTDILRPMSNTTAENQKNASANEQRFENLLSDARADRKEWRADLEEIRSRADADRQQWQNNYDAQLAEVRALGEQNRALLSALATTNRRIGDLEQVS
ncbi:MAG: hypothetical protein WA947_20665 [Phormidesmis sp.]